MNTIDYKAAMCVKPVTLMSMHVNVYTHACETRVERVSHAFSVELLASLYCIGNFSY